MQNFLFYDHIAFLPITWINPRAGVMKHCKCMGSHVVRDITIPRTVQMVCYWANISPGLMVGQLRGPVKGYIPKSNMALKQQHKIAWNGNKQEKNGWNTEWQGVDMAWRLRANGHINSQQFARSWNGFKLCTTTHNNIQQHVTSNNVASVCTQPNSSKCEMTIIEIQTRDLCTLPICKRALLNIAQPF